MLEYSEQLIAKQHRGNWLWLVTQRLVRKSNLRLQHFPLFHRKFVNRISQNRNFLDEGISSELKKTALWQASWYRHSSHVWWCLHWPLDHSPPCPWTHPRKEVCLKIRSVGSDSLCLPSSRRESSSSEFKRAPCGRVRRAMESNILNIELVNVSSLYSNMWAWNSVTTGVCCISCLLVYSQTERIGKSFSSDKGRSFPAEAGKGMMTWLAHENKTTCEDHMDMIYITMIFTPWWPGD